MSRHRDSGSLLATVRAYVPALVALILALFVVSAVSSAASPFRSTEVAFTDSSAHGLAIVPASCPSDPHYSGDCSILPSGCGPGTLNDQCISCTGGGPCTGTPPTCPDGSPVPSNGVCATTAFCPDGSPRPANGVCATSLFCPDGSPVPSSGVCATSLICPDGTPMPSNGICSNARFCPDGSPVPSNGVCSNARFCPDGSPVPSNGVCSQTRSCTASVSCADSTTIHYVDSSCVVSDVACPQYWTCGAGACIPPEGPKVQSFTAILPNRSSFTASGHLEAHPTLVRTGESTTLYWNVMNVASCTITSSNGGSWSCTGGSSACSSGVSGRVTNAIANQVTYTLACDALPGATPRSLGESIKVNVAPTYQEQ